MIGSPTMRGERGIADAKSGRNIVNLEDVRPLERSSFEQSASGYRVESVKN